MKELSARLFTTADLEYLGLTENELAVYGKVNFTAPCWTVRYADEVVFCAGIQRIMAEVGEAWLIFSETGREYIAAAKTAKKLLLGAIPLFRRIQATADPAAGRDVRFLEYMGFIYEGTLRGYGPAGQDMRMYSILREDR